MVRSHLIPVVIAGPTASGKSKLAMNLAIKHKGEIICADSRQFYKGMNIGTACPSDEDQKMVPHHGYKIIDPAKQKIDAGFFVKFATEKVIEIQNRNKRPILVGGGGLYFRALCYGIEDVPPKDIGLSKILNNRCDKEGVMALYEELKSIDPDTALFIKPNDRYRIIRALEIYSQCNIKPSLLRKSFSLKHPKFHAHWIYKKPDKKTLDSVLKTRVISMFDHGLVNEALDLKKCLESNHWALEVMGYKEALLYADNKISLNEAINLTYIRHRQYMKRQYTWFNKENFYRFIVS
jgi:tRNA dimethylallyltransferase